MILVLYKLGFQVCDIKLINKTERAVRYIPNHRRQFRISEKTNEEGKKNITVDTTNTMNIQKERTYSLGFDVIDAKTGKLSQAIIANMRVTRLKQLLFCVGSVRALDIEMFL